MSRKRPANDPPPPRETDDPLEKILRVLDETVSARQSLMDQAVRMQECLHVATTLHEMLSTAHENASGQVLMSISEQQSLQQLQYVTSSINSQGSQSQSGSSGCPTISLAEASRMAPLCNTAMPGVVGGGTSISLAEASRLVAAPLGNLGMVNQGVLGYPCQPCARSELQPGGGGRAPISDSAAMPPPPPRNPQAMAPPMARLLAAAAGANPLLPSAAPPAAAGSSSGGNGGGGGIDRGRELVQAELDLTLASSAASPPPAASPAGYPQAPCGCGGAYCAYCADAGVCPPVFAADAAACPPCAPFEAAACAPACAAEADENDEAEAAPCGYLSEP